MTIETSAKSVSTKAPDTADSRSRKSAGQTDAGPANGFMSILSAMDESAMTALDTSAEETEKKVPLVPVDTAQAATDLIAIPGSIPFSVLPLPSPDSVGARIAQGGSVALEAGLAAALPPMQATASPASNATAATRTSAAASKLVGADNALAADPMQGQTPLRAGEVGRGKSKAQPVVEQGGGRAVPESSRIQESRFMATLDALRSVQERGSAEPALMAGAMVPLGGEKPTAERGRFQERVAEGGFGAQPLSLGTTSYASPAVQDAGGVTPEMAVAQEVSYWISQDIQNAELKLDGLGLEAVEVSITVHGNEAHVAFRTDELQARSLLEGAAAHLKEALRGEGLVLSGVSVGTSGGRDSGDNERKQRQGGRQTATVPVLVQSAGAQRPQSGATGRTLDLFV